PRSSASDAKLHFASQLRRTISLCCGHRLQMLDCLPRAKRTAWVAHAACSTQTRAPPDLHACARRVLCHPSPSFLCFPFCVLKITVSKEINRRPGQVAFTNFGQEFEKCIIIFNRNMALVDRQAPGKGQLIALELVAEHILSKLVFYLHGR